jgi:ABC-type transport system substrate-binding protein
MAIDWELIETGNPSAPMNITYTLRRDLHWQDGRCYTAHDAAFNLNFHKTWMVPRYSSIWQFIVDIEVHSDWSFTVMLSETNWVLLYDLAGLSAYLPPQVWDRAWASQQEVLDYDPSEPYNVAAGYTAGPWASQVPTNLFGTGPWVFQYYDSVNLFGDLRRNVHYFMTQPATHEMKIRMFHEVGDVNEDGVIDDLDITAISFSFGYFWFEPEYDPEVDINGDGIVDIRDLATAAFYLGWKREYP